MDNKDLRTLKILEEIDNDHVPSQRDLARKLNISLGLVNSFIKRLAQKGYFKITTIPKNRVRYILTPKGAAEKTRLTYEYIQFSFKFYKTARNKLRKIFRQFDEQNVENIVFLGASELAEIAYVTMQESHIKLVAIADRNTAGDSFLGYKIVTPDELKFYQYDKILITTTESTDEVLKMIDQKDIDNRRITLIA